MIINDIITFNTKKVFDDYLVYKLDVTYSNSGDGTYIQNNYDSDDIGINIKDHGVNLIDFELDERVLVPSEITIKFNDSANFLDNIFFNGTIDISSCNLEIYKNNVIEYKGKYLKNPLDYLRKEKELTITFITDIDKLNTTMVRDQNGNYTNPLSITDISMWNPDGDIINGESVYLTNLSKLIKRVYEHINPNVTFSVNHNWLYHGIHVADYSHLYLATFDDLYIKMSSFYNNEDSLADCLKKICNVFFAKTGMPSNDKAFFRKLYYYNNSNVQSIIPLSHKKYYKYDTIRYLMSKDSGGTIRQQLPSAELYTLEPYSKIGTEFHQEDLLIYIIKNNKTYLLSQALDPDYSNNYYYDFAGFANILLYDKRSKSKYNREDSISVKGLNIDYQKNFKVNNSKYEINTMQKVFAEGYTKIDALYLGEDL